MLSGSPVSGIDLRLGDCLEVMKDLLDNSVNMVMCDLPYGTTQCKWDSILPLDKLWPEYLRICSGAIVLTACQPFTSRLVMSLPECFRYEWIWHKNNATGFLDAKRRPLNNFESVLVFSKRRPPYFPQMTEGKLHNRGGGTGHTEVYSDFSRRALTQSNLYYPKRIIRFDVERKTKHPTQKPVALMEYLIKTYTQHGETVLDNCMGSGTTGIACINTGRRFIGIEQDPQYFQIAKDRIAATQTEEEWKLHQSGIIPDNDTNAVSNSGWNSSHANEQPRIFA